MTAQEKAEASTETEAAPREPLLRGWREHGVVLAIFSVLSLLATFPLILNFSTQVPAPPHGGDAPQFLWNLWWVKTALLDLRTNPFYSNYIFYPDGASLVFHTLTLVHAVVAIPFMLLTNIVVANNVTVLLGLVLAGWGAYLLADYVVKDKAAALVAGVIFAFAPYVTAHFRGLYNLTEVGFIPFYVLFLLKTVREPRPLNGALAGLFLGLALLNEYVYGAFLLLFTALYLVFLLLTRREVLLSRAFARRFALLAGVFALFFLPIIGMMAGELAQEGDYVTTPLSFSNEYAADLLAFFTPSTFSTWFGTLAERLPRTGVSAETTVFAGYLVLGLSVFAAFRLRRGGQTGLWLVAASAFAILSLGPILHVAGRMRPEFDGLEVTVPLPFLLLHYVPFVGGSRFPARYDVLVMLALAVLAALGVRELAKVAAGRYLLPLKPTARVISGLVGLAIFLEFLVAPISLWDASVPPVYKAIAAVPGDFSVLQLPFYGRQYQIYQWYYQTVHGKRIIKGGVLSRIPPSRYNTVYNNPAYLDTIPFLRGVARDGNLSEAQMEEDRRQAKDVAARYGIRFIVIHKDMSTGDQAEALDRYVREVLPVEKFLEDGRVIAYEVR